MFKFKASLCVTALAAGLALAGNAEAFPSAGPGPLGGVVEAPIAQAQYYGGRRCFYPDGWHGPGFYRCGFRFRRGLGFFGPGVGYGGRGGAHFHGGRGFGGGGHFGGGHGGGHFGGGHFGGGHGGGGHGGGGHGGGGHGGGGRHR